MKNPQGETWRILHIDDDEDDHYIVRSMLREAQGRSMQIEWAPTLKGGRQKLNTDDYDAVLIDYDMGVDTGISLIREFVDQGYSAPLILLTGRGSYEVDVEAMHAGATLYLTKDEINPLLLERSIRYAIQLKQSQAQLRLSEEKFAIVFERSPIPTFLVSLPEAHFMDVNQAYLDLLGYTRQAVTGKNPIELGIVRDEATYQDLYTDLQEKGSALGYEFPIYTKSGDARIISANLEIVEIEGNRYALGTAIDITRSRQAEEALQDRERSEKELAIRFQEVLENSLDVAYRRDLQSDRYDYLSPVVEQVLGFTVDEMKNMSISEVLERTHPDDRAQIETQLARAADLNRGRLEYRFRCKDGEYRWLADNVTVSRDAAGNLRYRTGSLRDITEKRELEQQIEAERSLLLAVLDALPVGVWVADQEGRLIQKNLQADRIWAGDTPLLENVQSYPTYTAWYPSNQEVLKSEEYPVARALATGQAIEPVELEIRRFDGTHGTILVSAAPVRDAAGALIGVVGINVDITARKQSEEALRLSEERFRLAARATEDVIWDWNLLSGTIQWNEALIEHYGYLPDEIVGQSLEFWEDRVHPDDQQKAVESLREIFSTGGDVWTADYRFRRKDGSYAEVFDRGWILRDPNGIPVRMVGAMHDNTLQHEIEHALRQSEAEFRQLADAMPQLVWTARPDGSVDYYNQRASLYNVVKDPESDTWDWHPTIHPDDLPRTQQAWQAAQQTRTTYQIEHRLCMADGGYAWHLTRALPVFDSEGSLVKWYGTATDIHVFKEIQEALRFREQRMRHLFDANLIGIVTRDEHGKILEANDAYLAISGYTREEIEAGAASVRAITPPEYHHLDELCTQELIQKGVCKPYEKEYQHKDGRRLPILIGYSVIDGDPQEYIGFALDLSELKQAQAAMAEYAEKLRQSNESLENFAFLASHDLQEPLRKIHLFGESLRKQFAGQLTREADDTLTRMQNAAQRMQGMVQGLLDLYRVNTHGRAFTTVDLSQVVNEVISDLEPAIQAAGGQVLVEPLPSVPGDELQLRQLFQNLIGNAIKFHRDGEPPVVHIWSEPLQSGDRAAYQIAVQDNGAGFDESAHDLIFQPFMRLHNRSRYEGSGIGLAISRKIAERHGGSLTATSRIGEGSQFTVVLPRGD